MPKYKKSKAGKGEEKLSKEDRLAEAAAKDLGMNLASVSGLAKLLESDAAARDAAVGLAKTAVSVAPRARFLLILSLLQACTAGQGVLRLHQ